jgi:hypothetical protein
MTQEGENTGSEHRNDTIQKIIDRAEANNNRRNEIDDPLVGEERAEKLRTGATYEEARGGKPDTIDALRNEANKEEDLDVQAHKYERLIGKTREN